MYLNKNKTFFKKQMKHFAGIYGWINIINNKIYVGRALSLDKRPIKHTYFDQKNTINTYLQKAMKKNGLENFVLIIFTVIDKTQYVEYINKNFNNSPSEKLLKNQLIELEDTYLNIIKEKPKYNILEKSSNSIGYKHTEESKQKMKEKRLGTSLSESTKKKISLSVTGQLNPFYGKKHSEAFKNMLSKNRMKENNPMYNRPKSPEFIHCMTIGLHGLNNGASLYTQLTDTITGKVTFFETFKDCCQFLGYSPITVRKVRNTNKLLKNRWKIHIIDKPLNK
jgi:group I intron endonuclease